MQSNSDDEPVDTELPWRQFVHGLEKFIAQRVPASEVKDVLQDTLVRVHEAADSLRDTERTEAWVFSIARRAVADFYRARERRPEEQKVGSAEFLPGDDAGRRENLAEFEGDHSVHEEVLSWLRPMAEQLSEPDRRALVMADFEGHTQKEVANELGLSLSGAKSRIQRARVKLGEVLQRCCEVQFSPGGQAVSFCRKKQTREDS